MNTAHFFSFQRAPLQVQFCNWKKAKGGFPGYLILASIMCLCFEIGESHLAFLLAGALCHSWPRRRALPKITHFSSSSLYHEWCSCFLYTWFKVINFLMDLIASLINTVLFLWNINAVNFCKTSLRWEQALWVTGFILVRNWNTGRWIY